MSYQDHGIICFKLYQDSLKSTPLHWGELSCIKYDVDNTIEKRDDGQCLFRGVVSVSKDTGKRAELEGLFAFVKNPREVGFRTKIETGDIRHVLLYGEEALQYWIDIIGG